MAVCDLFKAGSGAVARLRGAALVRDAQAAGRQRQRRAADVRRQRAVAAAAWRWKRSKLIAVLGRRSGRDRRPPPPKRLYHRLRARAPASFAVAVRHDQHGTAGAARRFDVVAGIADHQQPAGRNAEHRRARAAAGRGRAFSSAGRRRRSPREKKRSMPAATRCGRTKRVALFVITASGIPIASRRRSPSTMPGKSRVSWPRRDA